MITLTPLNQVVNELLQRRVELTINRRRGLRRLSLRVVAADRLRCSLPSGLPEQRIIDLIFHHRAALVQQLNHLAAREAAWQHQCPDELWLAALEQRRPIVWQQRGAGCQALQNPIVLAADKSWPEQLAARVLAIARDHLPAWLERQASRCGIEFQSVTLRRQKSRWGSCSAPGRISLNAALIFCPPPLVDYTLVHELAHRRHLNHSPAFWAEVARLHPDWQRHDRELSRMWQQIPPWFWA
jgi:predicted metal-dependent hydrolase